MISDPTTTGAGDAVHDITPQALVTGVDTRCHGGVFPGDPATLAPPMAAGGGGTTAAYDQMTEGSPVPISHATVD